MTKETVLLIGLGEIGHTLFSLLKEEKGRFDVYGLDLDKAKMRELGQSKSKVPNKVNTMQVCLPCGNPDKFAEIVADYAKQYNPNLTIINSTIPPGTTLKVADKCKCLVAHSPARGVQTLPP